MANLELTKNKALHKFFLLFMVLLQIMIKKEKEVDSYFKKSFCIFA